MKYFMKQDKLNIKALIVAILFAVMSAGIFAWMFFSLGLNHNFLLGSLTFIAIVVIDFFESYSIYALHKNYEIQRQKLLDNKK